MSNLSRRGFLGLLPGVALTPLLAQVAGAEDALVSELGGLVESLRKTSPETVPLAFWDFDGTLLKGDCSEGFAEKGEVRYQGLVEVAVEAGLSKQYPRGSHDKLMADYREMEHRFGAWLAYGFLAQIFQGARPEALEELSQAHFEDKLRPWFFADSARLWRKLESLGVQSHVISASADFFVSAAAPLLGLPRDRVHGIRLAQRPGGLLSHEILAPMTYAEGKAEKLRQIVTKLDAQAMMGPRGRTSRHLPVAAFGNSHHTDGAMLRQVAKTSLPAGKPFVLMINGGEAPAENKGLFRETSFSATAPW